MNNLCRVVSLSPKIRAHSDTFSFPPLQPLQGSCYKKKIYGRVRESFFSFRKLLACNGGEWGVMGYFFCCCIWGCKLSGGGGGGGGGAFSFFLCGGKFLFLSFIFESTKLFYCFAETHSCKAIPSQGPEYCTRDTPCFFSFFPRGGRVNISLI